MTTCSENEPTLTDENRMVEVHLWDSALDDGAKVVQIDTGSRTNRIRVVLNEATLFDGLPEHDGVPGRYVQAGESTATRALGPRDLHRAAALADSISPEQAAHVLWFFGEGGHEPGSFTKHLLEAMTKADPQNFWSLSLSFTEYAAAVVLARQADNGIALLRRIFR